VSLKLFTAVPYDGAESQIPRSLITGPTELTKKELSVISATLLYGHV
jgi:hypothetical protein